MLTFAEDRARRRRTQQVQHERRARRPVRLTLSVFFLLAAGCAAPRASLKSDAATPTQPPQATPAAQPAPAASPSATAEEVSVGDSFVEGDGLSHAGYTVSVRRKSAPCDYPPEMKAPAAEREVEYAALERGGKAVLTFDAGVHNCGLNDASFGLLALLGGEEKQLVVSQDAPRGGRQWVVRLGPRPRVIFDGPRFGVGREGADMRVADLDGDGAREVMVMDCGFYGFRGPDGLTLAPMHTPLPTIVFKYDPRAAEYLPANRLFRDYLLKDIAAERARIAGPATSERHLADVLSVLVDYVYAGEEQEAWAFYEAAYALPDKARVRREVRATLRARPVYRFLYPRS